MNIKWENETGLALRAVAEGGRLAANQHADLATESKGNFRDIVTEADRAVERLIRDILAVTGFPMIGEEGDGTSAFPLSHETPVWVVDPIDGTTNYANGLPTYCVSVGLCQGAAFLAGAVCLPKMGELFNTLGDDRAMLNGRFMTHKHKALKESLAAASFPAISADDGGSHAAFYRLFGEIDGRTRGCLRTGSAAINLCYAAVGRLQAAYGLRAKIWDVAGGLAIARSAGCKMRVEPNADGTVNYVVGSTEAVEMIYDACRQAGFMRETWAP